MQITPEALGGITPLVTAGALVIFGAERSWALYRALAKDRKSGDQNGLLKALHEETRKDLRNAITTHGLQQQLALRDLGDSLRREVDDRHKALLDALRQLTDAVNRLP